MLTLLNVESRIRQTEGSLGCESGFTQIELLAICGAILLLASIAFAGVAGTKSGSQGFQCLANTKTLMMANMMYQTDNRDVLPLNYHGFPHENNWVTGFLGWTTSTANTNTAYLLEPYYASLAVYFGRDLSVYKCPVDVYASAPQRMLGWTTRSRSVSANLYVGESNGWGDVAPGTYRGAAKSSDLNIPGPARTWVYIEEHPDSINDGCFWVPRNTSFIDFPATYHNGAAAVAMADGHSEIHRWQGPAFNRARSEGGLWGVRFSAGISISTVKGDPDLYWLTYGTPRRTSQMQW